MSEDFEVDEEGYRVRKGDPFSSQQLHGSDDSDDDGEGGTRHRKKLEIVIKESPIPTPSVLSSEPHQPLQQGSMLETVQTLQVSSAPLCLLIPSLTQLAKSLVLAGR